MKREIIKFRGKRKDTQQWIYGSYHLHQKVSLCISTKEEWMENLQYLIIQDGMSDWNMSTPINTYEVIPESVGEFTGLKDKNGKGKDIYEGDVIYLAGYGDYVVEFPYRELYDAATENDIGEIKGNIHDNPELL